MTTEVRAVLKSTSADSNQKQISFVSHLKRKCKKMDWWIHRKKIGLLRPANEGEMANLDLVARDEMFEACWERNKCLFRAVADL